MERNDFLLHFVPKQEKITAFRYNGNIKDLEVLPEEARTAISSQIVSGDVVNLNAGDFITFTDGEYTIYSEKDFLKLFKEDSECYTSFDEQQEQFDLEEI